MTTDTKLLEGFDEWHVDYCSRHPELSSLHGFGDDKKAAAAWKAATAAKDAEIEALRVDVEAWKASHSMLADTCHHFQALLREERRNKADRTDSTTHKEETND